MIKTIKWTMAVVAIGCMFVAGSAGGQAVSAKAGAETLHQIRKEKFDLILPGAMRDNGIDMWIHVIRYGNPDPLQTYFGGVTGYIIFTDRGGDRIERALLSDKDRPPLQVSHPRLAEGIPGKPQSDPRWLAHFDRGPEDLYDHFGPPDTLREFVEERNPKRIAVNFSKWLAVSDGISHTEHTRLKGALGSKLSDRIVSAEQLVTDFRVRRTKTEIAAFSKAVDIHLKILERALSNEVITPGETTLGEVAWWVQEELLKQGVLREYTLNVPMPRVLYSHRSERVKEPDARWWIYEPDYVIQYGDFGTFDIGIKFLDSFITDFKRNYYVLEPGETEVPDDIQFAFDRAIAARDIIVSNIKVGNTVAQTIEMIVRAMESAGYIYTPFIDIGTEDYKLIQSVLDGKDESGFSLDSHPVGNNRSIHTVGAAIAPFRTDRHHMTIQNNHLFALEYMVHTNMPERPGFPMSLNIEGNHIVTERGVEFIHPVNEEILLVR